MQKDYYHMPVYAQCEVYVYVLCALICCNCHTPLSPKAHIFTTSTGTKMEISTVTFLCLILDVLYYIN